MLIAARDASETFCLCRIFLNIRHSETLPKIEDKIGNRFSPMPLLNTNELYADVFSRTYGMECIGLRYFNVFGRQSQRAYAASFLVC